jgi:hypothetical protein
MEAAEVPQPRRVVREEPAMTNGGGRNPEPPPARPRADSTGMGSAPAPATPARRGEAPAQPQGGGGRAGWLSDILTRASREEAELPPQRNEPRGEPRGEPPRGPAPEAQRSERNPIDSLDSLAVDIARMIDHEEAADLWDRYKRGERNVFTRKLYTMQGQQAFEEIRRKYRGDRDFMRTVDRYIAEFERLLEEVSRDDRGQVVARTYLTSETGKVYTMLAHAAGRFD